MIANARFVMACRGADACGCQGTRSAISGEIGYGTCHGGRSALVSNGASGFLDDNSMSMRLDRGNDFVCFAMVIHWALARTASESFT